MDSEKERDPVARKLRAKICVDSWAETRVPLRDYRRDQDEVRLPDVV